MTQDYPDWTRLIQLIGADIMMPIDIQGSYIMMPVDIQAQYITLDIDIVAQTIGNISIDLAAQSVGNISIDIKAQTVGNLAVNVAQAITLNIDITAQTIGNLTMDIEAQSVGVYLQPDWQVKEGTDKNLTGNVEVASETTTTTLDYTIPANKTFYVCQWSFTIPADAAVTAQLFYKHNATEIVLANNGGRPGNAQSFTKPIAIVAGDHLLVKVKHFFAAAQYVWTNVGGYEI